MTARIRGPLAAACVIALAFATSVAAPAGADAATQRLNVGATATQTRPSQGGGKGAVFPAGQAALVLVGIGALAFGIAQRRKKSD